MSGPTVGGHAYLVSDVGDAIELADLREHVGNLAVASGFGRDARRRAVLAIHEAAALACRLVGADAEGAPGVRAGARCTVRIDAGPELLVAEIELPDTVIPPAAHSVAHSATDDADPLRYVRTFAPDTGWADGPGPRRLRVAVRDDG